MDNPAHPPQQADDRTQTRVTADTLIVAVMALGGLMAFAALLISVSGFAH